MLDDESGSDTVIYLETPEEAAQAIASALGFLRDEARAAGMHDLHIVIDLARAAASAYCRSPTGGSAD
jgi:hypothetical protein